MKNNWPPIVEMLGLYRALQEVMELQRRLPNKYARYFPHLQAMKDAIKVDIAKMGKDLPAADIQHFVFAATHRFYKRGARQAFNKLVKT